MAKVYKEVIRSALADVYKHTSDSSDEEVESHKKHNKNKNKKGKHDKEGQSPSSKVFEKVFELERELARVSVDR